MQETIETQMSFKFLDWVPCIRMIMFGIHLKDRKTPDLAHRHTLINNFIIIVFEMVKGCNLVVLYYYSTMYTYNK